MDNFFMVMPEHSAPTVTPAGRQSFQSMLTVLSKKLARGGSLRVLTDMEGARLKELVDAAGQAGFKAFPARGKEYFPKGWRDPEFRQDSRPQFVVLAPK